MSVQTKSNSLSDNLFLVINRHETVMERFLKPRDQGQNSRDKIVKEACLAENITGTGDNMYVTTHGLHGTLVTIIFKIGHVDFSVALRIGVGKS